MEGTPEAEPTRVPAGAKQVGEVRARWAWAEPAVWTERMLTALEAGVKGGVWFSLIDKVYAMRTLEAAFAAVKKNRGAAGVDHQTIEMFEATLGRNLERMSNGLCDGSYRPQAIRRVWIPKAGKRGEKRPLGIPTVRDRVVQAALRHVIEPIFERDFADGSYGFRPGRGAKDALRRVDGLLKSGRTWVVDADIRSYFDTIPHGPLMELVRSKVADGRVLSLIELFLKQQVMETAASWTPEAGSPQGAVLSPLLSNIYLDPLDHLMAGAEYEMVRYADDFVVLCGSRSEAERALSFIQRWMTDAGLTLHPDKTRIVDATERGGFDFLGYHFERGKRWPSRKSVGKLHAALRTKTRRTNGESLDAIIHNVNRTLRGWFAYFKHSLPSTFPVVDGWVRMRLRSILRKRRGGRGCGRGRDHPRWPNAYFAERGLYSFVAAYALACQSSRR
jgi:RNA-directed DNA polymerase